MNLPHNIKKYLSKSPEIKKWQLTFGTHELYERAIVIPALAESSSLLKTLVSLAVNGPKELASTLVICVVNNRQKGISSSEEIQDNGTTLAYLSNLVLGTDPPNTCPAPEHFNKVKESGMKIAFIDASTPGNELPDKGGVGLARKIGMDLAVGCLNYDSEGTTLLICLDADTLVESNYLAEIGCYFASHDKGAAVVAFSHILPEEDESRASAIAYELFLRYYEAGLTFAGSPYAYQTIGSTIVCRASAYTAIGGMNRKRAGEDFYFLQNLAKYGNIGHINATAVHPSMRISDRVPFGTGRKMGELAESDDKNIPFYNPEIFRVLKSFIQFLNSASAHTMNGKDALDTCREINALLSDYLLSKNFSASWDNIKKNSRDDGQFKKNLHVWFDAFQTFKLTHHLRDNGYGTIAMLPAIRELFVMAGLEYQSLTSYSPEKLLKFIQGNT